MSIERHYLSEYDGALGEFVDSLAERETVKGMAEWGMRSFADCVVQRGKGC
jgi:hypothetical protein